MLFFLLAREARPHWESWMGSFVLLCKVCVCMYSLYVHPDKELDGIAMQGVCVYVFTVCSPG